MGSAVSDSTIGKATRTHLQKASETGNNLKNAVSEKITQSTGKVKEAVTNTASNGINRVRNTA
mgnify:CR=1 FL=1